MPRIKPHTALKEFLSPHPFWHTTTMNFTTTIHNTWDVAKSTPHGCLASSPVTLAKFSTKPPPPTTFISVERDCECLDYGSTVPYSKLKGSSLRSGNVAVSMQAVSQGLLKREMPLAADI